MRMLIQLIYLIARYIFIIIRIPQDVDVIATLSRPVLRMPDHNPINEQPNASAQFIYLVKMASSSGLDSLDQRWLYK